MSKRRERGRVSMQLDYFDEKGNFLFRTQYTYSHCILNMVTKRPIMKYAYAHIRGIIENGGQCALPGCNDYVAYVVQYVIITVPSDRTITPRLLKVNQHDYANDEESRTKEKG